MKNKLIMAAFVLALSATAFAQTNKLNKLYNKREKQQEKFTNYENRISAIPDKIDAEFKQSQAKIAGWNQETADLYTSLTRVAGTVEEIDAQIVDEGGITSGTLSRVSK